VIPEPFLTIEKFYLRLPISGPQKHVVLVQNRKDIALGLKGGFFTFPALVIPLPAASHMRGDMADCLTRYLAPQIGGKLIERSVEVSVYGLVFLCGMDQVLYVIVPLIVCLPKSNVRPLCRDYLVEVCLGFAVYTECRFGVPTIPS
jgi:hypothetical protein